MRADAHSPQSAPRNRVVEGSGRRLLDTYADSLIYTNHLISREFRRSPRKVPAHMPHMVDVSVMEKVQDKYALCAGVGGHARWLTMCCGQVLGCI